ncbi:tyrosine-type recombinase/integrase [Flavobacterium beibuense]|uniref:tyrosine-type recombinase/integrase n=1 Tax=Flavobacterium beibuense TaxID=657326 RepID=UPI003A94EF3B
MNYKFSLHNHVDKKGRSLLYLHITQDSKRQRIPLEDMKIEPRFWDQKKQRAKSSAKHVPHFNLLLDNIERKITTIKTTYHLQEMHLTLDRFKEEFLNTMSRTDFLAFMKKMLDDNQHIMKEGTHKNQMKVWRKLKKHSETIRFSEITLSWISDYKNFLLVKEGLASTSMFGHIKVIKKYLNEASKRGVKLAIETRMIHCGSTSGNRVNLDGEEVDIMAEYFTSRFIKDSHKVPLGLFLLSCFNGFRISDAQQITKENISKNKIIFTSVKTGKRQVIAINLTTKSIINHCPEILSQKFTDQHINRTLKDIAQVVGIKKEVTFHVARHTFATNYLRLGGKVEVLQQILGHSDIKETMIYVHIVQEEQDRGMLILDNLIEGSHFSQLHANTAA